MLRLIKGNKATFEDQIKNIDPNDIIGFHCSDDAGKFVALIKGDPIEPEKEVIEKIVEKEIEKIVEVEVDNPVLLEHIASLEASLKECDANKKKLEAENKKLKEATKALEALKSLGT